MVHMFVSRQAGPVLNALHHAVIRTLRRLPEAVSLTQRKPSDHRQGLYSCCNYQRIHCGVAPATGWNGRGDIPIYGALPQLHVPLRRSSFPKAVQ